MKFAKLFLVLCMVFTLSHTYGNVHADEIPPKLKDFIKHVGKYHDLNVAVDEYFVVLGWVYRLQWDKIEQMPDSDPSKASRKQHMESLWWELRDHAYQEGEKWKIEGAWPSGSDGMFNQLKGGFEQEGKLVADDQNKVRGLSLIPSLFDDAPAEDENYDDLSVEALAGRWRIGGTYVATGRGYGSTHAWLLNERSNEGGFKMNFETYGNPLWEHTRVWKLTEDGIIELKNPDRNQTIKFYRQRKDYWSTGPYTWDDETVELVLSRNQ
jgi:hypothetical protein